MPLTVERLIHAVLFASGLVFAVSLLLIAVAIALRFKYERDLRVLENFSEQLRSVLGDLFGHTLEYGAAVERLKGMIRPRLARAAEQVLLAQASSPGRAATLQTLLEDLGMVGVWQAHLEGRRKKGQRSHRRLQRRLRVSWGLGFLSRAQGAENLGRMQHLESWPLLASALRDPHPDVQAAALRALAAIGEPQSFPILLQQLRAAVSPSATELSERDLRSALARFPLDVAGDFTPSLLDAHPRLRYLSANVLREIVERGAARGNGGAPANWRGAAELEEAILTRLPSDESADVRAGAADLLAMLPGERAAQALRPLLEDTEWFVRLHAVRAARGLARQDLHALLCVRLSDPHWRVREAAAQALAQDGQAGLEQLLHSFLATADLYIREQIVEALEISGLTMQLLLHYQQKGHEVGTQVLEAMMRMGKTSCLRPARIKRLDPLQRQAISSSLARYADGGARNLVDEMEPAHDSQPRAAS